MTVNQSINHYSIKRDVNTTAETLTKIQ